MHWHTIIYIVLWCTLYYVTFVSIYLCAISLVYDRPPINVGLSMFSWFATLNLFALSGLASVPCGSPFSTPWQTYLCEPYSLCPPTLLLLWYLVSVFVSFIVCILVTIKCNVWLVFDCVLLCILIYIITFILVYCYCNLCLSFLLIRNRKRGLESPNTFQSRITHYNK